MTAKECLALATSEERFEALKKYGHIGSISAEEREQALQGVRIDHHLTDAEVKNYWSIKNRATFNQQASARHLNELYSWREDKELADYYLSQCIMYNRIPVGGVSDYREVDDYEEYAKTL